MISLLKKIITTGIISKNAKEFKNAANSINQEDINLEKIHKDILQVLGRALTIRAVDAGSCNACELEIQALQNPYYNIEGVGIKFVASPRHADMLLVSGVVTKNMENALKIAYECTPAPKLVVALGDCAVCGGLFGDNQQENYAICGKVENIIPISARIPGCPPPPALILQTLLSLITYKK